MTEATKDRMLWHAPHEKPFRLAGFAWFKSDPIYRRLPRKPDDPLPPAVDTLANCTAGGQIHFQTDSRRIAVRVVLSAPADMVHMPATGQCGFDIYLGPPCRETFCTVTKYDRLQSAYESVLVEHEQRGWRHVTLNFPLYQGVKSVDVGLDAGARIKAPPPYARPGRVVVYGTSITQGGCASRPGMAWTNILSRRLNVEFINLGFSGSGRGEPEVARAIAAIPDPALLILDYEANAGPEGLRETLGPFIDILRATHPATGILVVSRIRFAGDRVHEAQRRARQATLRYQRNAVRRLRALGDQNVFFQDGSRLLGSRDEEGTVDGVHPNDLGFHDIADGLTPVVRRLLQRKAS